jgi:hypothetical protein
VTGDRISVDGQQNKVELIIRTGDSGPVEAAVG